MITPVTSLQNQLVKDIAALRLKKARDETGLFFVEGARDVAKFLSRKWALKYLLTLDATVIDPHPDKTYLVTPAILEKITGKDNPQTVIGVFEKHVTKIPASTPAQIIPCLEEIRDPGNLGTIIRTADALGIPFIILIGPCCDPFAPETLRAAQGSVAAVEIMTMPLADFAGLCKKWPGPVIGTDVISAVDYRSVDYTHGLLVMGNEQKGLSPEIKALCTRFAHIPMPGGTESLNVAIATTLLAYEAHRGLIGR